jgi:uncharacterized lipoprotein YehR (DUF1307 family)
MKSIRKIDAMLFIMVLGITVMAACKKSVLDKPLEIDVQDTTIFKNIQYTTDFVTDIYSGLPNGFTALGGTLNECATDDARHANPASESYRFTTGSWNETINSDDVYAAHYQRIRKCNIFFQNVNLVQVKYHSNDILINGITATSQLNRIIGEVFFLRAFYYFELAKRYGGVPIVTQILSLQDNIKLPRNTFEEVVAQITKDCDSAFNRLPATYIGNPAGGPPSNYYGRATKWTAQALKARILLYAASGLNNPNNNLTNWTAAASAAKLFFDGSAPFTLAVGITGYEGLFKGNTATSTEIIWSRPEVVQNYLETANFPVGEVNGNGGVCPSQYLVDAFEMKDGLPYSQSPLYNAVAPYSNRDPRFASTIYYNGAVIKTRTIQTYTGGSDGPQIRNGSLTGYYMRKLLDPTLNLASGQTSQHNCIYFRLAEMLLDYAEAINEAQGPVADVYTAINRIRTRVGMPNLPVGLAQVQMRDRIRNERRIELCFEGHRYWDARRWDIAKDVFNRKIRGMQVVLNGAMFTYTPYDLNQMVFDSKMNRYPFQLNELQANPNLEQNPGW